MITTIDAPPTTDIELVHTSPRGRRHDLWPLRSHHTLASLDLNPVRSAHPQIAEPADGLAAVADAAWSLARSRLLTADLETRLNHTAAMHLFAMAEAISGPQSTTLRMQATAVARGDWPTVVELTVTEPLDDVAIVYGPFKTWTSKANSPRPAALVSVPDHEANHLIAGLDTAIRDALPQLAEVVGMASLDFWTLPDFVVTDLLACGGEANSFPKHFALFLPEDTGVGIHAAATRTVVYGNVYRARFEAISRSLGAEFLDPCPAWDSDVEAAALMAWFRGHDAAHFLGPHGQRVDRLVGYEPRTRGGLFETLADVLGYLLVTLDGVRWSLELEEKAMAGVFLSELLRYYRRGPDYFPDSIAARLELRFLVENDYLGLDRAGGHTRLLWDVEGLQAGLRALGTWAAEAILGGDDAGLERLVAMCRDDDPAWLVAFEDELINGSRAIGDSLVFVYD